MSGAGSAADQEGLRLLGGGLLTAATRLLGRIRHQGALVILRLLLHDLYNKRELVWRRGNYVICSLSKVKTLRLGKEAFISKS